MAGYLPFHRLSAYQQMPRVIAHRGACGMAPENTAAAIRLAAQQAATWVEVDVAISADEVAVIFHDRELSRCSNGSGLILQHSLSQLKQLDTGSWYGDDFQGEKILTLVELLQLGNMLGLSFNLEVKPSVGREAETVWAIRQALQQVAFEYPLLLSSFNPVALQACLSYLPDISRALNVEAIPHDWQDRLEQHQCQGLHFQNELFDKDAVSEVKEHGVAVAAFTVNTIQRANELWQAGVDAVFTDYPKKLLTAYQEQISAPFSPSLSSLNH